jgi:lipoprotein signal peptidase
LAELTSDAFEMRSRSLLFVLCSIAVFAIDQWSKVEAARVDPSVIAHNPSYAMGVIDGPAHILAIGTLITLFAFVTFVARGALRLGIPPVFPALVAGGMLGNVYDRIVLASVRDFIVTPWAICNIADVAIVAGILASLFAFAWRAVQLRGEFATVLISDRR